MRKWRERAKTISQNRFTIAKKAWNERQKLQPIKSLWKRVSNIGKNAEIEPITTGEIVVGILIILTVVFLYVFNLFLVIGDWLNSIVQIISIVSQWLSGLNFS